MPLSGSEKSEIAISLFSGVITERGREVALSPRERELLMWLAARQTGLAAEFDASRPALRVLVVRVRSRFENPIVLASGSGQYRLSDNVRIDLSELRHELFERSGKRSNALAARVYGLLEQLRANPQRGRPSFEALEPQLERLARRFIQEVLRDTRIAGLL